MGNEISVARASMTPATSKLFTDGALSYRLGRGSLAGSLNDDVRFRFEGTGPAHTRKIVPDSASAQALMQSEAGAKLISQLRVATNSAAGFEDKATLRGFVLPKDEDGVVAGMILCGADNADPASLQTLRFMGDREAQKGPIGEQLRQVVQEQRQFVQKKYRLGVAAWTLRGWITFRPDIARNMLTSVGAYEPPMGSSVRRAKRAADLINHVPMHEMQHTISPSVRLAGTPAKWMEEAICEVLSNTPVIQHKTALKTGVNKFSYAGRLSHPADVNLGWGEWNVPRPSEAEQKQNHDNVSRNYLRSQDVLRELVRMGGMGFNSNAKIEQVRTFLQGEPADALSSRLASVISEKNGIPEDRHDELAMRIAEIVDTPNGLSKLRKDFGIPA